MLTRRMMLAAGLGGLAGVVGPNGAPAHATETARSVGEVLISTSGKISHIVLDADTIYWTESTSSVTRLCKRALAGGAITTLASEPRRDAHSYTVTYWHIQQTADSIIWSRQRVGFYQHYSLRIVPKSGGTSRQFLKEGYSESPLPLIGWRVAGRRVAVALLYPHAWSSDLPKETRIAVYDLDANTWSPLVTRHFKKNEAFILAVDGDDIYLRGTGTEDDTLELGKVSVSEGISSYTTIHSASGTDDDLAQLGATDGTNVYYWSEGNSNDRILASPLAGGGDPVRIVSGDLGTGLTTNGVDLFWQVKEKILKIGVDGQGAAQTVFMGAYRPAAVGGLAYDETGLYLAVQASSAKFQIVKVGF